MKKSPKKNKKIDSEDFEYQDQFKEDLIHQLWHLVNELQQIKELLKNLEKL